MNHILKYISFFLLLIFTSCGNNMYLQSTSTPTINYIDQDGGTVVKGQWINLEGSNLEAITDIKVGGYTCLMTLKSSTQISCTVSAELEYGIYPVKYQTVADKKNYQSDELIKFYAGAVVIGADGFSYTGEQNTSIFSATSLSILNSDLILNNNFSRAVLAFDNNLNFKYTFSDPHNRKYYNLGTGDIESNMGRVSSSCQNSNQTFLMDAGNNRILVYSNSVVGPNAKASYIIGQASFNSNIENAGQSSVNEKGLDSVSTRVHITCTENMLYVPDSPNHRILGFPLPIQSNLPSATLVLGQPDFNSNTNNNGGLSGSRMWAPTHIVFTNTHAFVADKNNNRVLIFDLPLINSQTAIKVIGQANLTSRTPSVSISRLRTPSHLSIDSDRLYVTDEGNQRIVFFDISDVNAMSNGQNAIGVLGQPDFNSSSYNAGQPTPVQQGLFTPTSTIVFNNKFYISDLGNNRLLEFSNALPSSLDLPSTFFGQTDFTKNTYPFTLNEKSLGSLSPKFTMTPNGIWTSILGLHRMARFPSYSENYPSADLIIGQPDLYSSEKVTLDNIDGTKIQNSNSNLFFDPLSQNFIVPDAGADRVLIWSSPPTTNNQPADIVLGQPDFTTGAAGSYSATTLPGATGVCRGGNYLFVGNGHRIARFTYPLSTGMSADLVLGQTTFGTNILSPPSANTFNTVRGLYCDENRLIAIDGNNYRILIWTPLPTTDNQPADIVLGQSDFTSNTRNWSADLRSYDVLSDIDFKDNTLAVTNGDQIYIYENFDQIYSGQPADYVLGSKNKFVFDPIFFNHGKNRIDNFSATGSVEFLNDQRFMIGNIGQILILPYKHKD